jgi:hypothetical protein
MDATGGDSIVRRTLSQEKTENPLGAAKDALVPVALIVEVHAAGVTAEHLRLQQRARRRSDEALPTDYGAGFTATTY